MNVYHYTTGAHLPLIAETGFLKLTPSKDKLLRGERACVWFSSLGYYPPTARPYHPHTGIVMKPSVIHKVMGQFRFMVDSRRVLPYHRKVLGWSAKTARKMEQHAKDQGEHHTTWYCSIKPVPVDALGFQSFDPTTADWTPANLADHLNHPLADLIRLQQ